MDAQATVSGASSLSTIPNLALGAAIWAEMLGVPVAWFKLRRTDVWANRPPGVRRIDLLSTFVAKITGLAALWGAFVATSAVILSRVT
jgi:hypothetical protein